MTEHRAVTILTVLLSELMTILPGLNTFHLQLQC